MTKRPEMPNKKRVLFILPSLVPGGAERIISFLSQNLDTEKFISTLLVVGKQKENSYDVSNVETIYLEKNRVMEGILPMFKFIRKNRPDLVVTAIGHLNSAAGLIALFFPKIKFIAREVNVISVAKQYKKKGNPFLGFITKISYRFIDAFICQSKDMRKDFLQRHSIPERKVVLINNPITDDFELKERPKDQSEVLKFITVASLKKQKGHIRILKALAKCNIPFNYTIIGNGSELEKINECIDNYGLSDKVTHIPFTKEVSKYLGEHHLFLQGSYVEGFPNALLESCSAGTPVLAFDAPGGLDEIIEEGINGFIAKDESEFIGFLNKCKEHSWNPIKVNKSVTSKFSKTIIIKKYENLFLKVLE